MREHGGFEGNAQTLRIVARLEKKSTQRLVDDESVAFDGDEDLRCGLNLTFRSLAFLFSNTTYMIPKYSKDRKIIDDVNKGYYEEERLLSRPNQAECFI